MTPLSTLGMSGPVSTLSATTTSVPSYITSDLVLNVDAGDNSSYGGSGTTWTDLSGNGNNITLSSSGISYNSTDGGGSIVFDGTNGQGTSSINLTNMNSGGSLEIWCKITDTSGYRHIGGWRDSASAFYMLLLLGDGRMEARAKWASSSNTDIVTSDYGTSFWANNWNHIVFTNSDSDSKTRFYLNGSLVSTSSGTVGTLPSNTLFELMKTANLSTATAAGRLSQVRVYSDTLSASEVTQNYNATKSRFGIPSYITSDLVLNLDAGDNSSYGGSGTTWTDLSGEGNNGTISGATYTSGYFDFDGTDDRVTFASGQDVGGEITISFWVYPTLNSSINTFLSTKGSASASGYAFIANTWNTSDRKLLFEVANGSSADTVVSADNVVVDNQWQNFVVTCVRSTGATVLYKNGSSIVTDTLSVTNWGNTGTFEIGKFPSVNNYWYNGNMSIAQVYTAALTASEVAQNFNAIKGRYGL